MAVRSPRLDRRRDVSILFTKMDLVRLQEEFLFNPFKEVTTNRKSLHSFLSRGVVR